MGISYSNFLNSFLAVMSILLYLQSLKLVLIDCCTFSVHSASWSLYGQVQYNVKREVKELEDEFYRIPAQIPIGKPLFM